MSLHTNLMYKCLFVLILLLQTTIFGHAQNDTVLVDFGSVISQPPWNNITNAGAGASVGLVNSKGFPSGMSIAVTDAFTAINTNGTSSPSPLSGFPPSATSDNFFGNTVQFGNSTEPTGAVQLTGLNPLKRYKVILFASRIASDNRETQFAISGLTSDTFLLNVSNNTTQTVEDSLFPDAGGTITVTACPGPNNNNVYHFFHLSALKVIYEHIPTGQQTLELISPEEGAYWQSGQTPSIQWKSQWIGLVELAYSINGGVSWQILDTTYGFLEDYPWTIPVVSSSLCKVRLKTDSITLISENFSIGNTNDSCLIVVLGSSTAAGAGASVADSAWVARFRTRAYQRSTRNRVINMAKGGFTTWNIMPTGTAIPPGVTHNVDTARNITAALSLNPYAIIINLPSNDAAHQYSVIQQLSNYAAIQTAVDAVGSELWVTTTQPRNFSQAIQLQIQQDMADSIQAVFGPFAINFWSGIADYQGHIVAQYNSGDGIHLNDAGHRALFERVKLKGIDTINCTMTQIPEYSPHLVMKEPTLFPNPFINQITAEVTTGSSGLVMLVLSDLLGRTLAQTEVFVDSPGTHLLNWTPDIPQSNSCGVLICTISVRTNNHSVTTTHKLIR